MMTFTQLEQELLVEGVRPTAFRINQTPIDNTYCILFDGERTEVFYSERGMKLDVEEFEKQEDGMQEFKRRILENQSTRADWDGVVR